MVSFKYGIIIPILICFLSYNQFISAGVVKRQSNNEGENTNFDQEAETDSTIELACELSDTYGEQLKWTKLDGEINEDRTRYYEGKLIIYYSEKSDSGEYECTSNDGKSSRTKLTIREKSQSSQDSSNNNNNNDDNNKESNNHDGNEENRDQNNDAQNNDVNNDRDHKNHDHDDENDRNHEEHNRREHNDREESNSENNEDMYDLRAYLSKSYIKANINDREEITCTAYTNGDSLNIEWYDQNGQLIQSDGRINLSARQVSDNLLTKESTLTIFNLNNQDFGTYECKATIGSKTDSAKVVIAAAERENEQLIPSKYCDINEATCLNGQCIARSGLCDGRRDCLDGSDESNCGGQSGQRCEPNEKACRNGFCAQKIWFCDGDKDCDDGSDEETCVPSLKNDVCKPYEFQCKNRVQCVWKSLVCDDQFDCEDQSDEIGCEIPRIIQPPTRNLTVIVGSTFRIECKARGFPDPYINWRLNWGHVCDEPRCYSTNVNGDGVFTVTDARFSDAGAYSCEAINSEGRIFAVPDTIVTVIIGIPEPTRRPTTTPTTTRRTTTPYLIIETPVESDCNCHNHTADCTCSGRCLNCKHNTYGDRCQYCLPGFYGDATVGTPYDCMPTGVTRATTTTTTTTSTIPPTYPPEPIIETDCECNNHTIDCTCSGRCLNCKHNTMGDKCQYCKPGFFGDATRGTPYDCVPDGFQPPEIVTERPIARPIRQTCNPYGTLSAYDDTCQCKTGVTGQLCDQCKPRYFNLVPNREFKKGCLKCFCNGLSVDCKSSDNYYKKIKANFEAESGSWYISNKFTEFKEEVYYENNAIHFEKFDEYANSELYFIAPPKFKGNKLPSYGGNITFSIKYTGLEETADNITNLELRISGFNINILHVHSGVLESNVFNKIVVPLHEDHFKRYGDNGPMNQDFMLMVLSNIELIMIKAQFVSNQLSVSLTDFSFDYADKDPRSNFQAQNLIPAKMVEVCSCPRGYTGNSCESCSPGYQRSLGGFYWGLCEPAF